MKIKLDLSADNNEDIIIIKAKSMTPEIARIVSYCSSDEDIQLPGFQNDLFKLLNPGEIVRIYTQDRKVLAETFDGVYELKLRLYELEEKLNSFSFIRISKSELINLKQVSYFEPDVFNGLGVVMKNKNKTYVSRRFVSLLKERIGV